MGLPKVLSARFPRRRTGERSRVAPSRPPPRDHDNNKADEFAKLGLVMEPQNPPVTPTWYVL